jgi:hypothetical protein
MAAAAILKLDGPHFRYCDFQTQHAFLRLRINFSFKSDVNCPFYSIHLNFQHGGGGHLEQRSVTSGVAFLIMAGSRETKSYSSNFIEIGRKLTELLQFEFFHNGGCRHLGLDDR